MGPWSRGWLRGVWIDFGVVKFKLVQFEQAQFGLVDVGYVIRLVVVGFVNPQQLLATDLL